jgi:hypothetical protein
VLIVPKYQPFSSKEVFKVFLISVITTAILIFLGGFLVSALWNILIPAVFGLPALDLVQGVALVGLIWIIRGVVKD